MNVLKELFVGLARKTAGLLMAVMGVCTAVSGPMPWTHPNFQDDAEDFRFAIVPDRGGGDLRGAFTNALDRVDRMRPNFIMSVGDLVNGLCPTAEWNRQQDELTNLVSRLRAPFFAVVGNHDIGASRKNDPDGNERSKTIWQSHFGTNTYYSFVYKRCLFLVLNTSDGRRKDLKQQVPITDEQYAWARQTLKEHADVRWTFVFMHQPDAWRWTTWKNFEKDALGSRKYTVFAGDWHKYFHVRRNGHDYYILSVAGGVGDEAYRRGEKDKSKLAGPDFGEMDHITWVTMCKDGPSVMNLTLDGMLPGDYLNRSNTKADVSNLPDLDEPSLGGDGTSR